MFGSSKKKREKIDEVGIIIGALERYISHVEKNDWDKDSGRDFDDHMSIQFDDKRAEVIRQLVHQAASAFPGEFPITYSESGMNVLRAILSALKKERGL